VAGELAFDSNLTSVTREQSDIRHPPGFQPYFAGVAGTFTRAASRASWKRGLIVPGGQLIMPFSYLQADAYWNADADPNAGIGDDANGRVMLAAGIEYEWPFLATLGSTVHTFGPKAQLIARPNEWHPGANPNEDSQSLVFDDTSLFEWDKFSGYDRQEGALAPISASSIRGYSLAGRQSMPLSGDRSRSPARTPSRFGITR